MGLARIIRYCLELRRHDKLPAEAMVRIQHKKLVEAVVFAKQRSKFYAQWYKHVDPRDPGFNVQRLPPVTKELLMEHFDEVVTDPRITHEGVVRWAADPSRLGKRFLGRYVVAHTSGTTGTPGHFIYNPREWDWIHAHNVTRGVRFKPRNLEYLRHAWRLLGRRVRVSMVGVVSGHFVTYLVFLIRPWLLKPFSRFAFHSVCDPIQSLVEALNRFQPNVLHGYPTMLEMLAYEQMEGRLDIKPWIITSSSEPLALTARRVIQEAFPRSELFQTYGTTEGVAMAAECRMHQGLHLNNDTFVVEPVYDDGTPVEAGQLGSKVYLSCLFSRTMPLLRYELNDVMMPLQETCSCGLSSPLVKVRGRADDIFWVYDSNHNSVALPPIPFEALFLDIEGLRQYQLIQTERNRLRILFRPAPGTVTNQVRDRIQIKFEDFLVQRGVGDTVALEVEAVDEIPRDRTSGKIRQIKSLVERLYVPGVPLGERRCGEDRRNENQRNSQGERRTQDRRHQDPES